MLERFWLILILLLASIVPPMHAAQVGSGFAPSAVCGCLAADPSNRCACEDCPCAAETEQPIEQDPAVPSPRSEQKRVAEPVFDFAELVLEDWSGPRRIDPASNEPVLVATGIRIESLLCVWRI